MGLLGKNEPIFEAEIKSSLLPEGVKSGRIVTTLATRKSMYKVAVFGGYDDKVQDASKEAFEALQDNAKKGEYLADVKLNDQIAFVKTACAISVTAVGTFYKK